MQTSVFSLIFAALVPFALLSAFRFVGHARRKTLRSLLEASPRLASTVAAEYAAYKYDLFHGPSLPARTRQFRQWSDTLSAGIFVALTAACFACGAMLAVHPEALSSLNILLTGFGSAPDVPAYQQATAKFYTLTFAVSYIWSIYFLLRRVVNYALTPVDFLEASLQIVIAIFAAYVLSPLILGYSETHAALVLTFASIMIGLHRPLENMLFNLPRSSMNPKRLLTRLSVESHMPFVFLDGVDQFVSESLHDNGIHDISALAMANPVLLFVETSIGWYQAIDLVAQAQLACAVGAWKLEELKRIGIRTIFDLDVLAEEGGRLSWSAAKIIFSDHAGQDLSEEIGDFRHASTKATAVEPWQGDLKFFVRRVKSGLQVQRLFHIGANLRIPLQSAPSDEAESSLFPGAGDLEQRVISTITTALSAPTLIRYSGWVQAKISNDFESIGQIAVFVRFFQQRPEWGATAEVRIADGTEAPWANFDLELRVGLSHVSSVMTQANVPTSGNSKEFVLKAPYDFAEKPEIWLQIFQLNRLIQLVQLDRTASTTNASQSSSAENSSQFG